MDATGIRRSLTEHGLTGLEAQIYTLLLQEGTASDQRIAQVVGKPASDIRQALRSLQSRGALVSEPGTQVGLRPVPVEQFLRTLAGVPRSAGDSSAAAVGRVSGLTSETGVYPLRDRGEVYGKCRQILQDAQAVILFDSFLKPLIELGPDLKKTAARGLSVAAKVYAPVEVEGVEVILEPEYERIRDRWPAQWISLAADGAVMLQALLDDVGERVIHAVWSDNPFLSWIHHVGLGNELFSTALRGENLDRFRGRQGKSLRDLYERILAHEAPGYQRLLRLIARGNQALAEGEDALDDDE